MGWMGQQNGANPNPLPYPDSSLSQLSILNSEPSPIIGKWTHNPSLLTYEN
ncbi:LOW QUALITY PROTEIN: hypothetical protein TorRG33x02_113100 [Trema orientale]|uniref:Uncharacterized protein n=1 Tax=Trema orientale TaxID=63057 RepID=A0A2P5F5F6_TREOI|nr:LOW QUALITY PROTEIN: hypothetical protein TorRG33x02_113100 [Trema orientale]